MPQDGTIYAVQLNLPAAWSDPFECHKSKTTAIGTEALDDHSRADLRLFGFCGVDPGLIFKSARHARDELAGMRPAKIHLFEGMDVAAQQDVDPWQGQEWITLPED